MTTLMILRSRDNTPAPLLNMDREHEEQMINNFRSEMEEKIKEKEREQQEEKQEREKKEEEEEVATKVIMVIIIIIIAIIIIVATKVVEVVTEEVVSEADIQEGQTEPALPKDESIKVGRQLRTTRIVHRLNIAPGPRPYFILIILIPRWRFTRPRSTTSCWSPRLPTPRPTRSPTARR